MMRAKMLLLAGLLCSLDARADGLKAQIDSFIRGRFHDSTIQVKVRVRSPQAQWPQCELPQLSLPSSARLWGNISVSVRCGQERRFIQIQVQVTGRYLVSARSISAGSRLRAADLTLQTGRLDTLPPLILTDADNALGSISLRNIIPGQPLTRAMLRRAWVVKAGQSVQVIAGGIGFHISGAGKALNNAAANDSVRVRMASGQTVSGIAASDGSICITL